MDSRVVTSIDRRCPQFLVEDRIRTARVTTGQVLPSRSEFSLQVLLNPTRFAARLSIVDSRT